jgi:hypothetical protein
MASIRVSISNAALRRWIKEFFAEISGWVAITSPMFRELYSVSRLPEKIQCKTQEPVSQAGWFG